jgi:NAD(P)-dependent dehydrogenase (short-subunit alcohol dehydrogenase family)
MKNKIALITGGNRGIGLAIAEGLLSKGYQFIITARSLDHAQQAAEKLQGNVIPVELDVSSDRSIEQAVTTIKQKSDRLNKVQIPRFGWQRSHPVAKLVNSGAIEKLLLISFLVILALLSSRFV